MKKTGISFMMAAALAATLGLAACGGSSAPATEQAPAQETTTKSAPAEQAPAESTSTEAAPAAEATPTAETAPATEAAPTTETAPAQTTQQTTQANYIGEDAAKQAALTHAGVAEADATLWGVELDTDDATPHYEISFHVGMTEYEYDIDATTGAVLSYSSEVDD